MRDDSPGPRGGIRAELSGFVGRRAELGRVRAALAGARLVTLTGPGGIGKTRLAVQAATEVRRSFRDGAWMAELAGLRDPGLLAPQVARAFGLFDQSSGWAMATLADSLSAAVRPCWSWTTASICWTRAPSWLARSCGPAPIFAFSLPAARCSACRGR